MAFEERNGNRYYYRKERRGDKVVSEYIGTGQLADLCYQLDQARLIDRDLQRMGRRAETAEEALLDQSLDEITEISEAVIGSLLLINGYHQHKRQWRKRR